MPRVRKRNNSFELIAYLGYDSSGKQVAKSKSWRPPLTVTGKPMAEKKAAELAEKEAILWEELCLRGEAGDGTIKLSAFWNTWLVQHAEPNLAPKTVQEYKKLWKRINPVLGGLRMDRITPAKIQQFYTSLLEDGQNQKTGGKLSPDSVKHYHRLLSSMFTYATKLGVMASNRCQRTTPPKVPKTEAAVLTQEQAAAMIYALGEESLEFQAQIGLLLYGGMRRGELFAIKWDDLDFETGVLHIRRSISYIQGQGLIEKAPKNATSVRAIKLSAGILATLGEYRREREAFIERAGDYYTDNGYMFAQDNGRPRHPDGLPNKFKAFMRRIGFPDDVVDAVHLHTLRHSFASFQIGAGVDIRTVAHRLGHSQVTLTVNTYAHALQAADEAAAEALDSILKPGPKRAI